MGICVLHKGKWALIALMVAVVLLVTSIALGIAACSVDDSGATKNTLADGRSTRVITDQAGRQVTIPDPIKKVWCTSPIGTNLMYSLAPEMLVGWNITPTDLEKEFIPELLRDVSGMGGWYGKNTTGNAEEIIKRAPDVIFDMGEFDEAGISQADRVQRLVNIPVIMVDGDLTASGDSLRYIGDLLGVQGRANELADYCDDVIEEAKSIAAQIKGHDKVRVYYAEGLEGLNTDPSGSMHTEVLDLVGGLNVAQVTLESDYGMAPVSLEQVLVWDPEVILVASDLEGESNVYQQIRTESQWATVTAAKNHDVYQIPRGPFDWFDRPPCIARILGVRWLGNLLYPDLYKYDMEKEILEYYKLFYHMDLTAAQFQKLTERALRAD